MGMRMTERRTGKRCNYDGRERVMNGGECKTAGVIAGKVIVDVW